MGTGADRPFSSVGPGVFGVMKSAKFYVFGHRGACGSEPENTVRSVRRALEMGADGIEVDVYLLHGRLMVMHDNTLDRTTNGRGRLVEKSFAELRALDAGMGEKIPVLEEILNVLQPGVLLNIELKGPNTAAPVVDFIEETALRGTWRHEDFLISSFDHSSLREVKSRQAGILLGALFEDANACIVTRAVDLGAWSVHIHRRLVSGSLVMEAHRRGLKVFVYTINEVAEMRMLRDLGVDGIFTDYPDLAVGI